MKFMSKTLWVGVVMASWGISGEVIAQYNERPDLAGSGSPAVDTSGRSIKNKRVRGIHADDPSLRGATAWLFERDPFLAYQLGRNINFREFRDRDGVFSSVAHLTGPMPDGTTAKITANNHTSCLGCHNLPSGNPGGGTNFHKDSGFGRNAPHYYGSGLMEMLAIQIRADILGQLDENGDGWINAREANRQGRVRVRPGPGQSPIDFGSPRLSERRTGSPRFNNIIRVWYVDANGQHVPDATEVDGRKTFGYNLSVMVWGWGQGPGRSALNPTNRAFLWDPFNAHSGLESHDPSTLDDLDGDGVSEPTLAGSIQFPATHVAPDAGAELDRLGFSRDDPDGDGYLTEISEGDLDLGEWFMLNAPRPAFAGSTEQYLRGVEALEELGCAECHTPNWTIQAADEVYAGDRRFIDFGAEWNSETRRLEGKLTRLYTQRRGRFQRHLDSYEVKGLFIDFRHHDLGDGYREQDFGGNVNTVWRTAPLWGVGSGFPWGHDGQSLTLEDAVLRHGGEASASRERWLSQPRARRIALQFMERLVLYDIESLPADIDGDGIISSAFMVAGMDTGLERFNAEWLFRNPLRIQGPFVNTDGVTIISFAGVNVDQAYGQRLRYRRDSDDDGWPDVWDAAPGTPGYKDGVHH